MEDFGTFISSPAGAVVAAAVMFGVGWLGFSLDTRVEDRRKRAIELGQKFSAIGFKKLPIIFTDYGVGDYSGFLRGVHELHGIISDPAQREAELAEVFRLLLEEKLKDPNKLAVLKQLVDKSQEALNSGNPLALSGEISKQILEVLKSGSIGGDLLSRPLPEFGLSGIIDKPQVQDFLSKLGTGLQTFLAKPPTASTQTPAPTTSA